MQDMKTILLAALSLTSFACSSTPAPNGGSSSTGSADPEPVMCTQEAKMCPDGSAVGRTGPQCEFAPCPGGDAAPTAQPEPIPPG